MGNRFSFSKTLLTVLAIVPLILLGISARLWANESVKVGIFQNKPVVYYEDGPKGLFVEVLDHVAESEGWEIDYIPCELKECLALLKSNDLDLMTSLGKSPMRSQRFTFSEEPIWTFWGTIYAHNFNITSVFDLRDKTIGVRSGNKITLELQQLLTKFGIAVQYVEFDNYDSAFQALHGREIDVVAVNNTYAFEEQKQSDICQTPIVFSPFSAYFAAPPKGRHVKKLAVIDAYVKEFKADNDSFLHKFHQQWLGGIPSYWTGKRIAVASALVLFAIVCLMAIWRYRSLVSLNNDLVKSIHARQQTEKELSQSEKRFRHLVETAADAIFMFNKHGNFELVNKQACKSLGYIESELLQMTVADIDTQFTEKKMLEMTTGSFAGNWPITVAGAHQRKDGSTFPVEVRVDMMETEGTQSFVALARNISEREMIEEAIQQQAMLGQIIDNSLNEIYVFDLDTLRFTQVNQGARENIGYSLEELQQLTPIDIKPEFTQQKFNKVLQPLRDGEVEILVLETLHQRKDGSTYPVEIHLQKTITAEKEAFVAIIIDITQRKELEEERRRLAAAIDQASEIVMITNAEGTIQYVNPAFEKISGYSSEEAIGQRIDFLSSGKQGDAFTEKMWTTLQRGNPWSGHFSNKKKDGSLFEEEATISPVKNSTGQITNFVAVKRDVTKEASLEGQLRQAMKMEAIGTLAGGIAHDFNNILAAILGYGEMVRAELPTDNQVRQDIDQIIKAGNRAKELVKQILTFSRQGEEDFSPLQSQIIIKEALKLLRSSLPTTIQIQGNIDPNCRSILADPTQIHQVMMNLCTNAKHAMGEKGGVLTVSLSEVEVTGPGTIAACPQLETGVYLDLAVGDTGCGMDELTQSKIFDPFFTTKEIGKGTGLGLAVIHGIIKQHQGEISVESEPGQGTIFHIYLPIIDKEMVLADLTPDRQLLRGNERILIVDDEPEVVKMLQRMLDSLGYKITSFTSSVEALATYTETPDNFDLLITDMTMPDMTGTVLAKKLLTIRPEFPIILCTGFSETIDEEKALAMGIQGYILKPVLKNQLAAAVRKVFDNG